ncbi:apoptosis antagonizing transcription factor-domain-containing protein [Aspergillus crustosus]
MAPKSLAEQLADLDDLTPKDFDPEDIERGGQSSDEEAEVKDADAGREHYQAVGKAKLRNEDPISLGKQYAGSRVSRDALDADSDDDPFKARSGDEEGSDEEEDPSDELEDEDEDISEESEDDRRRKSKVVSKKGKLEDEVYGMNTDGSEDSDEDLEGFDEDGFSDEDEDEEDDDEDEDDEEDDEKPAKRPVKFADAKSDDREQLRQLMATDQKTIAATISQAAKADATKGKAVKQQRATFDALLNARIKLQKGLTAINQLSTAQTQTPEDADSDAFKSADTAALTLWSTLEDLRLTVLDAQTPDESKKRKRPAPATPSTTTSSLWKRMAELESDSLTHRRAILDKWSSKVRGSASTLASSKTKLIGSSSTQQTITAVLDAHVASETADLRASKRARNGTTTSSSEPDQPVYDDAIFYQSLLRDLVEQRMSSSDAITNGLDTLHILPSSRNIHPITGMRKDKVKRDVDTRASKGRKMRFDVHEKLQNFMASEDRGVWTTHAREEFFASLLGRSASGLLREESGDEDEAGSDGGESVDGEEGGLRLFRS